MVLSPTNATLPLSRVQSVAVRSSSLLNFQIMSCCDWVASSSSKSSNMAFNISFFLIFTGLLFHNSVSVVANLVSDQQALLNFVAAFPHPRKLNWNSGLPICASWIGVTCNMNRTRVVAVRLPGVGLYGSIPPDTIGKLDALRVLSLRSNYLSGNLPTDITSLPSLQYLYLQHNGLSGELTSSFSDQLIVLDLSYNSFTGNIPLGVKNSSQLTVLYLQNNSFAGPVTFVDLPSVKVLNLSYNNLSGSIPDPLKNFPKDSFLGNSLLCGLPLKPCNGKAFSPSLSPGNLPRPLSENLHPQKRKMRRTYMIIIAVGCSAAFLLLGIAFFVCLMKKPAREEGEGEGNGRQETGGVNEKKPKDFGSGVQDPEKNKLFFFEGCNYSFDLEDLLKASAEVLGKGSFGTAYKAVLEDSTAVVVKRLREVMATKREFEQQMEIVGKINGHPNIVPLLAYYYSKDEKLLVYKYMSNGSLFSLLHGNREGGRDVDWETRMRIVMGTSKAISYLHSFKCIHGNIKSSNILLTQDLEPCLSDTALVPLFNILTNTPRTIGYNAPEVIETRKVSQKSDVYSFGVLLLEMLTGKTPLTQSGLDDEHVVVDLPRWVRSVVREEWTAEVFDVELLRFQNIEEEMVQMLQIALACVSKVPDSRPQMEEVSKMIEDVRRSDPNNRTSSEAESSV
ncbi:PREDICTED: probable leucine-rich repeat receptor-like protein kinase At5g05160 isoform X2 [Tarenaya hassleriana]|nr:PREDICTED: probable leucine-rich repeat receptor-like protein kinase At5g05160 isoform X2 [Tarenaya hassleriana]